MLNVILKNHDFKYEVAELIKLFTSDFQFVENKSFGMVLENTLLEYNNTLISTSTMKIMNLDLSHLKI